MLNDLIREVGAYFMMKSFLSIITELLNDVLINQTTIRILKKEEALICASLAPPPTILRIALHHTFPDR